MKRQIDIEKISSCIREILIALGDDPDREGLRDTPKRVAKMYEEVFAGMTLSNDEIAQLFGTTFDEEDMVDTSKEFGSRTREERNDYDDDSQTSEEDYTDSQDNPDEDDNQEDDSYDYEDKDPLIDTDNNEDEEPFESEDEDEDALEEAIDNEDETDYKQENTKPRKPYTPSTDDETNYGDSHDYSHPSDNRRMLQLAVCQGIANQEHVHPSDK